MHRILTASLALSFVLTVTVTSNLAGPPEAPRTFFNRAEPARSEPVKWHDNLQAAHRQAVAENKPLLIVFGAEWCGFCTKLEKQTLKSQNVNRYISESFVPVHLDLDKEARIGQILEVKSLPCTIILSPKADLLGRVEGFHGPVPYQQKLVDAFQLYQSIQPVSGAGPVLR